MREAGLEMEDAGCAIGRFRLGYRVDAARVGAKEIGLWILAKFQLWYCFAEAY